MNILYARDVTKIYPEPVSASNGALLGKSQIVLDAVSCSFEQGTSYAVTGVSGSGKSTLLHILGGLDKPTHGDVFINEKALSSFKAQEKVQFFQSAIGFVFQFHYLLRELTVLENVLMAGVIKGDAWQSSRKKAQELLQTVGLSDKQGAFPHQLSGGEQQRVSLVRALFNDPQFLLADEPTGNLDEAQAVAIVDLLLTYQKERNMGLIICSHDKMVCERMDVVLRLEGGNLSGQGKVA